MTETTYDRYRRALEEIAVGVADPKAVAEKALTSLRPAPKYEWKRQQEEVAARTKIVREKRRKLALATYNKWLAAGRPPIAKFARSLGITPSSLERLLHTAERGMPWGQQRLGFWRNRRYQTADEIREADDNERRAKYGD